MLHAITLWAQMMPELMVLRASTLLAQRMASLMLLHDLQQFPESTARFLWPADDEQFKEEKAVIIKEISTLTASAGARGTSPTPSRSSQ